MSGSDLGGEDLTIEPSWGTMMEKPVTRGELIWVLQNVQVALLGQTMTDVKIIEGASQEQMRDAAERSVDYASNILEVMRKLVDNWRRESDVVGPE